MKEGHFWVPHGQLRDLRIHFLLNGQCPRTTLSGLTCISKLVVRADGENGKRTKECHIRQLPKYHDLLCTWIELMREHIDLKWRGDGLGPLALNVIEMLLGS